jgi:hypothetical protein
MGMNQTLFCRKDYQNGSASKTSVIQQVAHAETSEGERLKNGPFCYSAILLNQPPFSGDTLHSDNVS